MFCPLLTVFHRIVYATMVRPEMRLNNQIGQIQANVDRAEVKLEFQECLKEECAIWMLTENQKDGFCGLKHP